MYIKRTLAFALFLSVVTAAFAQDLKVSASWDNIRAHPAPLPVIGELTPKHSSLDRPSLWSVGVETLDRGFSDFSQFSRYIGETGAGYGRLQSGWARTEKKKGKYDFSWLDEHVDGLLAQGVHPWMCLCYGNTLYTQNGTGLDARVFSDGPVMDAWLKYVRATVRRYKGRVSMWEIWNEPDADVNLETYPLYANLFVRTARIIREEDPSSKIAALASCAPNRTYIRQAIDLIAKAGGLQYVDYITFHAYWQIPEAIIPDVKDLRRDIDAYDPGIRLMQGEAGCPSHLEYAPSVLRDIDWTETSQAKWELRSMLNMFGMRIPYSVFTMVDLKYDWKLQCMGMIRTDLKKKPVYKRPKFHVVQHVTGLFTPDIVPTDDITVSSAISRDLRCVGLGKDGNPVGCVLWFGGTIPTSSLDRLMTDIGIIGARLKDPVYVDLMTGYVHDLSGSLIKGIVGNSTQFSNIPLWDCPVVIIERDCLSLSLL